MKHDATNLVKAGAIGDLFDLRSEVILRWARSGDIPSIKLPNGRFLFDQEEVLASLKSGASINNPIPAATLCGEGPAGPNQSYEQQLKSILT